jgi:hypothetical protein
MGLRSRLKWFVGFVVLGYAASPAGAQTTSPAPATTSTTGTGGGAGARVGFEQRVNLPPDAQLAQVEGHIAYMGQASQQVGRRLQQARQQSDVVKMLCLNDKLSQIDVAKRSAEERKSAHAAAVGRHDTELSNHEYTILTVLRQRVEQLMTEANQCIGEEAAYTGTTTTFTTVDSNLPPTEDTGFPPIAPVNVPAPPVEVAPPQPASPSL